MSNRVVLFGSEGFVGSNILKWIKEPDVVAPSLVDVDFTNLDSLQGMLRPADIVVNAAGYANATDTTERGKALFQSVNVDGLRNLAKICADAKVGQLIHISSVAAMGRWSQEHVTEEMSVCTESPYAASKLIGEQLLAEYTDCFPITILRPTSVFGEGRGLAAMLCRLVGKGIIPLPGGGKSRIPFTYIGNIVHAVKLSIGNPNCFGGTFIVGDEDSYALRDVVLALAHGMGVKVKILAVPCPLAYATARLSEMVANLRGSTPVLDRGRLQTMTNSVSYSITKFQESTGYQPLYPLQQAAKRIATWYMEQTGL